MKVSREFKVGTLFVVCGLLLYWGVNFLTGSDIFAPKNVIYGVYDNTSGLDAGRPVNINGARIGAVESIDFAPDLSGNLIVTFTITSDYPIPQNSMAVIAADVLGNSRVDIVLGDSSEKLNMGDTIPTGVQPGLTEAVNEQLAPLKAKTEKLLGSLDTALAVFQGFLNEDTRQNFTTSFENLSKSFENLESITRNVDGFVGQNRTRFDSIVVHLNKLTRTLAANGSKLDTIFANVANITDSLAQSNLKATIDQLALATTSANEILQKVNDGEGSLGQLINNEELYENLIHASKSLDRLLLDLRYNPNRYIEFSIFGSSPRYSQEEIDELERQRELENSGSSDN